MCGIGSNPEQNRNEFGVQRTRSHRKEISRNAAAPQSAASSKKRRARAGRKARVTAAMVGASRAAQAKSASSEVLHRHREQRTVTARKQQ
ncbi:MAG TPA: hypothetical protein VKK79_07420 [Candidatus Lokiarchaeia archaeon]|nr:hypothetical protein [Candidatus Lokiarchaeia archaeon]